VAFEELSGLTHVDVSEFLSTLAAGRQINPHALDLLTRTALSHVSPLIGASQESVNRFLGDAARDLLL
jgi:hypothetical protein